MFVLFEMLYDIKAIFCLLVFYFFALPTIHTFAQPTFCPLDLKFSRFIRRKKRQSMDNGMSWRNVSQAILLRVEAIG